MNKIAVHIIKHPTQDRRATLDKLLAQLEAEPVEVVLVDGIDGDIGTGRANGYAASAEAGAEIVSYLDDDDEIIPGVFSEILERFSIEPDLDGVCTREESIKMDGGPARHSRYPFKYYDHANLFFIHHITAWKADSIAPHLPETRGLRDTAEHHLAALMLLNDAKIAHSPFVGYKWTEHRGSTSFIKRPGCAKSAAVYQRLFDKAAKLGFRSHVPGQGILGR